MNSKFPWKTLSSKVVYETSWIKMREDAVIDPEGNPGSYSFLDTPPAVLIIPRTPEGDIYIVGQYRYPTKLHSWEFAGGGSDGEYLLSAAKRELEEETGITAARWRELGTTQTMNGASNEHSVIFLAEDLNTSHITAQSEEAITEIRKVSKDEFLEMVASGEFTDSQSLAAYMKAATLLNW